MDKVEREVDQEIVDLEDEIADTYNQGYHYYYTNWLNGNFSVFCSWITNISPPLILIFYIFQILAPAWSSNLVGP